MVSEQQLHDEVNLARLVRRLEKSIADPRWTTPNANDTWIKAQSSLQNIKYAKRLLTNVESYMIEPIPKEAERYRELREKLDSIDVFMQEVEKRSAPKFAPPAPILPLIPRPVLAQIDMEPTSPPLRSSSSEAPPEDVLLPGEETSLSSDNLLMSPVETPGSRYSSSVSTLIPPTLLATKSTTTAVATGAETRFLQNSRSLQEEMSDQLAQMAVQLKRNAIHFSESLAKDQAVVEETQLKLEGNFDVMQKQTGLTKVLNGKTGSTTCLVMFSIIIVIVLFMFMVSLIRLT